QPERPGIPVPAVDAAAITPSQAAVVTADAVTGTEAPARRLLQAVDEGAEVVDDRRRVGQSPGGRRRSGTDPDAEIAGTERAEHVLVGDVVAHVGDRRGTGFVPHRADRR